MPEGHTLHRLARELSGTFGGRQVRVASPQGRFADAAALLDGTVLEGAEAWGKQLFVEFAGERYVHVHLGLYGGFEVHAGVAELPDPVGQVRLRLVATDELAGEVSYADLRGPTTCALVTREQRDAVVARSGPDPLRPGADPMLAWARIRRSRAPIGGLLMDQTVLAGVGNVYRAELLFRHGLHPSVPGRDVDPAVWLALWTDLAALMRAGVRAGRIVTTEPEDRERPRGPARRVDAHYVYRRTGLPCRCCGTPVRTAVLATRNVFWCPACQPEDG